MKTLTSLCIAVVIAACAGGPSRQSQEMDSLVGKGSKSYFVDKYGPPDKQATVSDEVEVWEYRLNEQKYTSNTGYRFATFERLRLTFTRGTLSKWSRSSETE